MNVLLHDPFESNIPGEITHSLLQQASQENKFQGSESTCFISFDPAGSYLAAGTRDGRTLIWDLNVFSIKKTLVGHVAPITCLDWHSLDRDSLLQNDLDPDNELHSILLSKPTSSAMSEPKEEVLVSGSSDWNVILWNPKTGARRDTIRFTSPVLAALLQPYTSTTTTKSSKSFPSQDSTTPTSTLPATATNDSSKPPVKGKGKQGAKKSKASSSKDRQVSPPSTSNTAPQSLAQKVQAEPIRLAVIAQGQNPILLERMRSSDSSTGSSSWKRTFLELPDSSGMTKSSVATAVSSVACCMQFSRDGRFLFVGTNKGTVAIFSPVTGKLLSTLKVTPSSIVKQIVFSRSGLDMIINSSDRIIRLYSVESAEEEDKDEGLENEPEEIAPEIEVAGKFLDSVDRTQWFDCCISADGEYVVGAKQVWDKHDLYIWDKKTGVLTKQLSGPPDGMMGMTWHPTRPVCATISGYYGCVYLWRHTPQQKFSAYEPTFTELEDNQEYDERESEFDVVEEKEKSASVEQDDMSANINIMDIEP